MMIILLFAVVIGEDWGNIQPTDEECWKAIGLSFAAGFSTVLGAFIALFIGKEDVLQGKSKFLAGSLSFAAAVMIYVSLIGVWRESEDQFSYVAHNELVLHIYTSLSFFGGIAIGYGIKFFMDWFENRKDGPSQQSKNRSAVEMGGDIKVYTNEGVDQSKHREFTDEGMEGDIKVNTNEGVDQSKHRELTDEGMEGDIKVYTNEGVDQSKHREFTDEGMEGDIKVNTNEGVDQSKHRELTDEGMEGDIKVYTNEGVDQSKHRELTEEESHKSYVMQTAMITAASIIAHNFPEGLVLFLAALVDWQVGAATAFAIALHNLPEGISIAAPYYYASESYWKAIGISLFSGLTEPIGAFIGWAIIHNIWGYDTFGILFGLTAGIMVYVSFAQLLPLARKNDPEDKVTTICCFLGMFVIDLSMWIEK